MPFVYEKKQVERLILTHVVCNRCRSTVDGYFGTLRCESPEGVRLSVYCPDCYEMIVAGDQIEPDEQEYLDL